eukprot:TRINITY_DN4769_c0_g1_i1.p1 TRINITY_DN4769_c0_g1~~TRINITY_DN4769_c0_g1_i1.p1  ORF type:complete len:494 (+),score=112.88 TRINITY_DN4769_c0_g1_i1:36-1484(+)
MPSKKKPATKPKVRHTPKGKAGDAHELREAAKEGDLSYVKGLATAHSVDDVDERGFTALHWAAWNGHSDVVKLLCEVGAGLDCADEDGQTALHHACWFGHSECVRTLLAHGADPNQRDNEKETPLGAGARSGDHDVIRLLIQANADPSVSDKDGHNPVSRALKKGHTSVALLLEDYMRVYSRGKQGEAIEQLLAMSNVQEQHYKQRDQQMAGYHTPQGMTFYEQQQHRQGQIHGGIVTTSDKGGYQSLTVLSGNMVRIMSSGGLPPVGTHLRLNGTQVIWKVVAVANGGGIKLQALSNQNVTHTFGEAGDDAGPGLWCIAQLGNDAFPLLAQHQEQSTYLQLQQQHQQQLDKQQQLEGQRNQYEQYLYYAQHHKHLQSRQGPSAHISFGGSGAREASMPLKGVPPAGSPRKSGYRRDDPAYRAINGCTVCGKVKPPLNFCEDCNEEMCGGCWVREHQNRKRRLHVPHPVEVIRDIDSGSDED